MGTPGPFEIVIILIITVPGILLFALVIMALVKYLRGGKPSGEG
jgi:hypothetical protein